MRTTPTIVLFLAASPDNRNPLKVAAELRAVKEALAPSIHRERLAVVPELDVQLDDLLRLQLEHRPAILHFSGHGNESGELLFNARDGTAQPVDPQALGKLFAHFADTICCVVLNACHSEAQARAIATHIPCVIAWPHVVGDAQARTFAGSFYTALDAGETFGSAFKLACTHAGLEGHQDLPLLLPQPCPGANLTLIAEQPPPNRQSPWNVPFLRNDSFIGREHDLERLHAALLCENNIGRQVGVTGLTGLGGIGKTQLVVEYCYRYWEQYPNGVLWINAADNWLGEFAALGVHLQPGLAAEPHAVQVRAAADYLRRNPDCLLVLDNVEDPTHLWRPVTAELIPVALPCRLLFTTRRRDVGKARAIEVSVLPEESALHLLLRHGSRQRSLAPGHPEHAVAQEICAMLGCLPLALELAGAFLGEWPDVSLAGYRQRLRQEGRLSTLDIEAAHLEGGSLSGVHTAAVAATLGQQWQALAEVKEAGEDARLLLRVAGQLPEAALIPTARLGLLAGLSAANAPGSPSLLDRALRRLERASLVEELREGQVRLHPLVHEFAKEQTPRPQVSTFRQECAERLWRSLSRIEVLEYHCGRRSITALMEDLASTGDLVADLPQAQTLRRDLRHLLRMLQHEAPALHGWRMDRDPVHFARQWHKRALIEGDAEQTHAAAGKLQETAGPYLAYKWSTSRPNLALEHILRGHRGSVTAVAVTADGRRAVSASEDNTLKVWDLDSGAELNTLVGHEREIYSVAVTADGRQAVSASGDNTLKVWDIEIGTELNTLSNHTRGVNAVAVTGDGRRAVSASDDKTLKVWDLASGEELHTLRGHTRRVNAVVVTTDGRRAVSASGDKTLKVWDIQSGDELHTLCGHKGWVIAVAVTVDGQRAVSASWRALKVWDLGTGTLLFTLRGHANWVTAVAVTPDGRRAVSASKDYTLKVWDLGSGTLLHTLACHTDQVLDVAVTADGRRAASASWDSTVMVWDLDSGTLLHTLSGYTVVVRALAVKAAGRRVVSVSEDKTLKVWDIDSGEELHTSRGHTRGVNAVVVTVDGRRAVSASADHTLMVWDLNSGALLHILKGHTDWVDKVAVTPDGRRAVSASKDYTLKVWDLDSGALLHTFSDHTRGVYDVAVTADGQWAVSASGDHTLKVWNLSRGSLRYTLSGHTGWVSAATVTVDGRVAVSASEDKTLKVWDLESGALIHTLSGHISLVRDVAVTADGRLAVSASWDQTLKVWDLESGRLLHTHSGHMGLVNKVAVSMDGRLAVSASCDSTIEVRDLKMLNVWDLHSGALLHILSGHTARVNALAVTVDGRQAVSASDDKTLKVWDLDRGTLLATIVQDAPVYCLAMASNNTILAGDSDGNVHCLNFHPGLLSTSNTSTGSTQ